MKMLHLSNQINTWFKINYLLVKQIDKITILKTIVSMGMNIISNQNLNPGSAKWSAILEELKNKLELAFINIGRVWVSFWLFIS